MVKRNNLIRIGCRRVILAVAIIVAGLPLMAYCQIDGTSLLLQQTPADGGTITPGVGIHNVVIDTEVTLTAVAKPGYQFVYWLGDVSDPTANSTTAFLSTPTIIIAVFERAEYEFLPGLGRIPSRPGGGLIASGADYGRQGYSGGGRKRPHKWRWPTLPPEEEPEDEFPVPDEDEPDFPVPEESDGNFPVPEPIPEPASAVLLLTGALLAITRRTPKK